MNRKTMMSLHWVWYLVWPLIGALFAMWFLHNQQIQQNQDMALIEFAKFKNVGSRFTATDGVELCEAYHALADHVGYEGPRPVCDYSERHR